MMTTDMSIKLYLPKETKKGRRDTKGYKESGERIGEEEGAER
jgi:hypothetical protein